MDASNPRPIDRPDRGNGDHGGGRGNGTHSNGNGGSRGSDTVRRRVVAATAAAAALVVPALARAQADPRNDAENYPSRSLRVIVPFPPGGTNDIVGRMFAERLGNAIGQSVIVENRGGAGGLIGTQLAAQAKPDGYTLLLGNAGALAAGLGLHSKTPYSVLEDFIPISLIGDITIVLVTPAELPVASVKELVELARAKPGTLNAAIPGTNSIQQLLTGMFRERAGIDFVDIPYNGGGPALIELLAGRNQLSFVNLPTVHKHIQAKQLRPLAVAGARRSDVLPDVPTLEESGYPGLTASAWNALLIPAGTPEPIVARLAREVERVMRSPETRDFMTRQGGSPVSSTPDATRDFIREESAKWLKVIQSMSPGQPR
ncbi:MAG: Bug family tripartite tricarboxylate transporter substrate binding protein [Lautropia sp.]